MAASPRSPIPVQGSSFVSFSWGSFAGDFPMPTDAAAIQNAQFNLKLGMVPIGFFGMEAILQSSEVVIPKLRAVMSDAAVVIKQGFAQALYANNYANPQAWDSLGQAYDDGTNVPAYGGITAVGQCLLGRSADHQLGGRDDDPRRRSAQILTRVQNGAGGEAPDYAVMNPANWAVLMADFMSLEMFTTKPRSHLRQGRRGQRRLPRHPGAGHADLPRSVLPARHGVRRQLALHRPVHVGVRADDLLRVRDARYRSARSPTSAC